MSVTDEARRATVLEAYPRLRRFFASKVPPAEVQDLAQATIVVFLEKDLSEVRSPAQFLFGIARNKLLQHFHRRLGTGFDSQRMSLRRLSTTLGTKLTRREVIVQAMADLALDQQMALELRYGEDLKLAEVAEAMDKSLAQTKRYIKDGLDALRTQLGRGDDEDARAQLVRQLGLEYRGQ